MKAFKRIGALLASTVMLGSALVGCTSANNDLYKAYTAEYTSGKVDVQMYAKINEPLPAYLDPTGQMAAIVEGVSLDMAMVYEAEKPTKTKAAVEMNIKGLEALGLGAEELEMVNGIGMWMDIDVTKGMDGKAIYKYPFMEEYLVLDLDSPLFNQMMPFDLSNFTPEKSKQLNEKIFDQIGTLGIKPVFENGVYTITVSKENLSNVSAEFISEMVNTQMEGLLGELSAEEKAQMETALAEMEVALAELEEEDGAFNEALAILDQIFAEDALVIKITLDENKLIHTINVAVNLNVDLRAIDPAAPEGIIDASLIINYVYSETNKPVTIVFPTITEENSINFEEYFMGMMLMDETLTVEPELIEIQ
jgi:hypothetical protein